MPQAAASGFRYAGRPTDLFPAADSSTPPELAAIVAAWPTLPDAFKAGIVAMVKATIPADGKDGKP